MGRDAENITVTFGNIKKLTTSSTAFDYSIWLITRWVVSKNGAQEVHAL